MSVTRLPNETERLLLALAKVLEKRHPAHATALKRIAKENR